MNVRIENPLCAVGYHLNGFMITIPVGEQEEEFIVLIGMGVFNSLGGPAFW